MKLTMNTVNVIELRSGVVESLYAYPDTAPGNKVAERMFNVVLATINNNLSEEELVAALDDGCYDNGNGREVLIVHSIENKEEL